MLDDYSNKSIKLIKVLASNIWGSNYEFGELNVPNSPYPEFELPMRLYHKVDVLLTYDRSILGIAVKTQEGIIWVDNLTSKMIFDGFESSKPENLLHNFQVLDEVVREIIGKEI